MPDVCVICGGVTLFYLRAIRKTSHHAMGREVKICMENCATNADKLRHFVKTEGGKLEVLANV